MTGPDERPRPDEQPEPEPAPDADGSSLPATEGVDAELGDDPGAGAN